MTRANSNLVVSRSPVAIGIDVPRGDLRHHFGHVGRHRLLEPQRIVGLDGARHAQRARGGELAVGAEQDVGAGADRLADRLRPCVRDRSMSIRRGWWPSKAV